MKLKLLLNIGSVDNAKLGLEETHEGAIVDVDNKIGAFMVQKGWAAPPNAKGPQTNPAAAARAGDQPPPGAVGGASDESDEESPVADTPVANATEMIGKMRSKDKLQHIIDNDPRAGVKDAARKRLTALG